MRAARTFLKGAIAGYAFVLALAVLVALVILAVARHVPEHTPVPARVAQLERLHEAERQWSEEEAARQAQFRREGIGR
jgi:hypothetical protein